MPTEKDIAWILKEVENYLDPDIKVRRGDVLAAWSGIRPLVRDPAAKNTAALVRNHMINVSESGLLTIAGGKWTTYRAMAKETIDKAIEVFGRVSNYYFFLLDIYRDMLIKLFFFKKKKKRSPTDRPVRHRKDPSLRLPQLEQDHVYQDHPTLWH